MSPNFIMYASSRLNAIPLELRSNIMFYAPLRDSLLFMGIEHSSFTRSSGGYATWRDGFQHYSGINLPRFEYTVDGKYSGLLLEPARVNYAINSENFTMWTINGVSVTQNDTEIYSPRGDFTAARFHANIPNAWVGEVTPALSSSPKVFSVYMLRRYGFGAVQLTLDNGGNWITVNLQPPPIGWQRLYITQTVASPTIAIRLVTAGDEIWVWGAQAENFTSIMSSYIPTPGSTIAGRSGDVLTYPWQNLLYDTNFTTIWLQDRIPKVNHTDGAPFDASTSQFLVSNPLHLMELVKFNRHLTSNEIAIVQSALGDVVVAPPVVVAPTPTVVPFRQVLAAGALSTLIVHNIGSASHKVYASTSWITRTGWSDKTSTTVVLHFDTEVPVGGGIVEGTIELG